MAAAASLGAFMDQLGATEQSAPAPSRRAPGKIIQNTRGLPDKDCRKEVLVIVDASSSMREINTRWACAMFKMIKDAFAEQGMKLIIGTFGSCNPGSSPLYTSVEELIASLMTGRPNLFCNGTSWSPRGPMLLKENPTVHGIVLITDGVLDSSVKKFAENLGSAGAPNLLVIVPWSDGFTTHGTYPMIRDQIIEVMAHSTGTVQIINMDTQAAADQLSENVARFLQNTVPIRLTGRVLLGELLIPAKTSALVLADALKDCLATDKEFEVMLQSAFDALIQVWSSVGAAGVQQLLEKNPTFNTIHKAFLRFGAYVKEFEDLDPSIKQARLQAEKSRKWEAAKGLIAPCFTVRIPVTEIDAIQIARGAFTAFRPYMPTMTIAPIKGVPETPDTILASFVLIFAKWEIAISTAVAIQMMSHVSIHHEEGDLRDSITRALSGLSQHLDMLAQDPDAMYGAPDETCNFFRIAGKLWRGSVRNVFAMSSFTRICVARALYSKEYKYPKKAQIWALVGHVAVVRPVPQMNDPLNNSKPYVLAFIMKGKKALIWYCEQHDHPTDTHVAKHIEFSEIAGYMPITGAMQDALNSKSRGPDALGAMLKVASPGFLAFRDEFMAASVKAWNTCYRETIGEWSSANAKSLNEFPKPSYADGTPMSLEQQTAVYDDVAREFEVRLTQPAASADEIETIPPKHILWTLGQMPEFEGIPVALMVSKREWKGEMGKRGDVQRGFLKPERSEGYKMLNNADAEEPTPATAPWCKRLIAEWLRKQSHVYLTCSPGECPVCFELFTDAKCAQTPCTVSKKHGICRTCLDGWLTEFGDGDATCPICRGDLDV